MTDDSSKTHDLSATSDGRWWVIPKELSAEGEETAEKLREAAADFQRMVDEHHAKHGLATYGCLLGFPVVITQAAARGKLLPGTGAQQTRIEAIAHGVLCAMGYEGISPRQYREASEQVFKAAALASDGEIQEMELIDG